MLRKAAVLGALLLGGLALAGWFAASQPSSPEAVQRQIAVLDSMDREDAAQLVRAQGECNADGVEFGRGSAAFRACADHLQQLARDVRADMAERGKQRFALQQQLAATRR